MSTIDKIRTVQGIDWEDENKGFEWPPRVDSEGKTAIASGSAHISCCVDHLALFPRGGLYGVPSFGGDVWNLPWDISSPSVYKDFSNKVEQTLKTYEDRISRSKVIIGTKEGKPSTKVYVQVRYVEDSTTDVNSTERLVRE